MILQRSVPGFGRAFSEVSISLDPPAAGTPSGEARGIALLRRARAVGVTTFDVADARYPARAERWIAAAFPHPDPELSVIVGRSIGSLAREGDNDAREAVTQTLEERIAGSLEASSRRLAPVTISWVDWDPARERESAGAGETLHLPERVALPREVGWIVRLPLNIRVLPTGGPGTSVFSGTLSPLEQSLAAVFENQPDRPDARLVARDPFAAGRLDGSRFARAGQFAPPGTAPIDVRSLHEEFDPVLRLGFLTERRRRTLAQAAIQFVLAHRWVATVAVPLPDPERFDEVLGFGSRPALSADEMERLTFVK